jgi:uncharacterized protein (TIGR02444 family)
MAKIWTFCEVFYGQKTVETLCLQLQYQRQVNIGLVIWLCWHAAHDRFITEQMFDAAHKLILPLHAELILPLRGLRKSFLLSQQSNSKNIAGALLSAEILLEKEALELLESNLGSSTTTVIAQSAFGLQDYLALQKVQNAQHDAHFLYTAAFAAIQKLVDHNYSR